MGKIKHGFRKVKKTHPLYKKWISMKQRCYDPNVSGFKYYGDRGIKVCSEWIHNPVAFIKWALRNGYKKNLHIDRINNDSDYSPENCRFVTNTENARNKTNNKMTLAKVKEIRAKYSFRKYTAPMLAAEYGVSQWSIYDIIWQRRWRL